MKTIGKFQVVEKIGEGGFGVIYKGLDPHIKRHVAIKSCTSSDESVRNRFVQEAQISGNLHHRHIVTVYDFGLQEGVPYLVQEYLNGEDLDRKIKRRDFIPFPEKLLYLMQIARGLQYAHSQGVVHRDIKPANLRILEDGTAKIMDFGIAKLTNQETGLTQTGMTLGTAAYLAPEQIRGESVDPRTDIFAYGATAYELLTYRRPFVGQHISTVLYQILNEEPPKVSSILPDVPPELDHLIERCLEKDLTKRYSDVGELLRDLDRLLKKRRTEITTKSIDPPTIKVSQVSASEVEDPSAETRISASTPGVPSPAKVEPDSPAPTGAAPAPPTAPVAPPVQSTPARETAASKTRTAPITAPDLDGTASAELQEIELDGTGERSLTPHGIDASQILQRRQFQWGPWAAGVVVFAAVALGAWTYWQNRAPVPVPQEQELDAADDGQLPEGEAPEDTSLGTEGTTPGSENDPGNAQTEGEIEDSTGKESTDDASPAELGDPVEATPPPANGRLQLPAAWSPSMTVSIGDQTYALDQTRGLELPPGNYTLSFRLELDGYSDRAERQVEVTSDVTQPVRIPIPRPGLLDVQPKLSSPQKGYVYLGQRLLGPSPVRGRQLKPGSYTLRIVPDLGPDQAGIETPIAVEPGGKLIVTFDLATGDMIQRDASSP